MTELAGASVSGLIALVEKAETAEVCQVHSQADNKNLPLQKVGLLP